MPEAVIVATARSPIGRAFKGSLTYDPPRRLTVFTGSTRPWPRSRSSARTTSTTSCSAAACPAASRASTWRAWSPSCSGCDNAARHHGDPVLLLLAADHPDGLPRHQGRRGRRVRLRRRGVRQPFRRRQQRHAGRTRRTTSSTDAAARSGALGAGGVPGLARPAGRTPRSRTSTSPWARPRRTSPRCAGSRGRRRTSSASGRRTWPRRRSPTGSGEREITPVTLAGRDRGERRRLPAARDRRWRRWPPSKPVFRPDGTRHRRELLPAQRRRRRGGRDERLQAARELGITPLAGSSRPA